MADNDKLHDWLKKRLTGERYAHSVKVQKRAEILAEIHGADIKSASVAGLLHDCCHCIPKDEQLKIINSRGILLDAFTSFQPQLWHSIAGSIVAEDELDIRDTGIINAIRYHTTGRADMTKLEQVVYLADYTSLDRHYPGVEENRALAEKSLPDCMIKSLSYTLKTLVNTRMPVVRDAWEAYNYFLGIDADS